MSSHYPGRLVYNADAACGLPGLLAELLVDSVPGRIDLLPAVPDYLPAGRLTGVRTLTGVRIAELRWNLPADEVTAVLVSRADQEITLTCHRASPSGARRVRLPAAVRVRIDLTGQELSDASR
jgi:alpha-L-fucosidase 2